MEIITRSKYVQETEYRLYFEYQDIKGGGYSFKCTPEGRVFDTEHPSYKACLTGTINGHKMKAPVVERYDHAYTEPAVGRCDCGRKVTLQGFTCPCECGLEYNSGGQLLAPREQWGEETGEHWSEF